MADFFKWTQKMSVGISEIDDQHKHFISLLNKVNLVKTTDKKEKVSQLLADLMEYARVHFTTEEKYFEKYKYPFANEHLAQHEKLLEDVIKFSNKFDKVGPIMVPELSVFLKEWLENHLAKHDVKYARYFKKNGFLKNKALV
jgi:hemerythrin